MVYHIFIWIRMHETFAEPLLFSHDPTNMLHVVWAVFDENKIV